MKLGIARIRAKMLSWYVHKKTIRRAGAEALRTLLLLYSVGRLMVGRGVSVGMVMIV